MGRRNEGPSYYASKNGWFTEMNGERFRLTTGPKSKTEEEARDKWKKLMATRATQTDGDRSQVGAVLNSYLVNAKSRSVPPPLAATTFVMHQTTIQQFLKHEYERGKTIGRLQVRDLKMDMIQKWVAAGRESGWCNNYGHLHLRILRTAFKWAAGEGELISASPFVRRGQPVRIGSADLGLKRLAITQEEHLALLAQAKRRRRGNFWLLLETLYHTGARPAEIYQARGDEWQADSQSLVIDPADQRNVCRLKTRRHLLRRGRKRVITVPDFLASDVTNAAAAHPDDYIIRKEDGEPWIGEGFDYHEWYSRLADRFRSCIDTANRYAKKGKGKPVRRGISLYSYRHAFVTRFLKGGGQPMQLCELLNTSLDMLQSHYSHLFEERQLLLNAVNRLATTEQRPPQQNGQQ